MFAESAQRVLSLSDLPDTGCLMLDGRTRRRKELAINYKKNSDVALRLTVIDLPPLR